MGRGNAREFLDRINPGDPLNSRERRIINYVSRGLTAADAAAKEQQAGYTTTENTVKWDLRVIRTKLNAKNSPHAVRIAIEQSWIRI